MKINLRDDADRYMRIAETIRSGEYQDVSRSPVYSIFLASTQSKSIAKYLQVILDSTIVFGVYLIGKLLLHGREGAIAGFMYAIYPLAWWRCAFISKETLITVVCVWFVWMWVWVSIKAESADSQTKVTRYFLMSGLVFGFLNLVKPIFLLYPVVLGIWIWKYFSFRPGRAIAVFLLGAIIMISPWTVRNYLVSGHLIPIALENGGLTLFVGSNAENKGSWEGERKSNWMDKIDQIQKINPLADDYEMNQLLFKAAVNQMIQNPLETIKLIPIKTWRFWFENASGRMAYLILLIQIPLLLAGLLGCIYSPFAAKWRWLFISLILYVWILHSIIYAELRYSLPVMPLVLFLGASYLSTMWNWKRAQVEREYARQRL